MHRSGVFIGAMVCVVLAIGAWYTYTRYFCASACPQPQAATVSEPARLRHVGIIMDGNRRWARQQGKPSWQGHAAGVEPVKATLKVCLERGIPYVSLYVFSLENFARPAQELDYLFNVLAEQIAHQELQELYQQGIKVQVLGDRARFPEQLRETIQHVEDTTKDHTKLTLSLLFCYAGQHDIVHAAQELAAQVAAGTLAPDDITLDRFRSTLWTGMLPPPDLIIRTGKAQRLSNFFTFDTAYAELLFLDCYWPDMTATCFAQALDDFTHRTRTFGA